MGACSPLNYCWPQHDGACRTAVAPCLAAMVGRRCSQNRPASSRLLPCSSQYSLNRLLSRLFLRSHRKYFRLGYLQKSCSPKASRMAAWIAEFGTGSSSIISNRSLPMKAAPKIKPSASILIRKIPLKLRQKKLPKFPGTRLVTGTCRCPPLNF